MAHTAAVTAALNRFDRVNSSPEFKELAGRVEFQTTLELLREYVAALSAGGPVLHLPPPPK